MSEKILSDVHEFHRTNDMAQVTFLKMSGQTSQGIAWEGNTCYWLFRVSDGLMDLIDNFASGEAQVEPREYNRIFTMTKREFYDSKEGV